MTDERYHKIMADVGMPNSRSLLSALQQVANEVAQETLAAERLRGDALQDSAYVAGLQAGFGFGDAGDSAGLERAIASRNEHVKVLTSLRPTQRVLARPEPVGAGDGSTFVGRVGDGYEVLTVSAGSPKPPARVKA